MSKQERPGTEMYERKVSYLGAIGQAIREEMRRDEAVLLLGDELEAVHESERINLSLLREFGSERVIETPMTEAAMLGSVVGAALMGMRPIAEIAVMNLMASGFEQILDLAAHASWRMGGTVPMVIRGNAGGESGREADYAEDETWLWQSSDLKIVAPSTVYDAKGLLKAAIRDDGPVLYLEHTLLYRLPGLPEELPEEDYTVPLGKAVVRREGEDMTMLSYGAMVHLCLQAAQMLEEDNNLAVEVLDLRTLVPLDRGTIQESVRRTNKVLFVHEDTLGERLGRGMSALITADLEGHLDGPVTRVAAPVPTSSAMRLLETSYAPPTAKILTAARALAAY